MGDSATDAGGFDEDIVLTVAELNEQIATYVDANERFESVWCRGEISNRSESDVAIYFTLTSGDASIECVLWQSRYKDIDLEIEDGLEVVLNGTVDFYQDKGRLSIKPWQMHALGEGERYAALERLRKELRSRGWFDEERKQSLPAYPGCVGVVTSRDGDARYDIQESIHAQYPDVDIRLCHASVQGDKAPDQLAAAITQLDTNSEVELIVVGRGGGSDDDLMAFNTEIVAEAIVQADLPVVTAIGHREDTTIADQTADVTAITPTAAGSTVVPNKSDELEQLAQLESRLDESYVTFVDDRLDTLTTELNTAFSDFSRARLDELETEIETAYQTFKHEQQKASAIEEIERESATRIRRYQVAVLVLLLLLLALSVWVIL